jgi:hypothetical protein
MSTNRIGDELTEKEIRFIDTWFNTGFNARVAYKMNNPHVTTASADAISSRILSTEAAQDYIELKKEQIRMKEEINLSFIVSELKSIIFEVKEQMEERDDNGRLVARKDFKSQLAALAQLSKLAGLDAPRKIDVTSAGEPIKISFTD